MNTVSTVYRSVISGAICAILVFAFGVADAALLFRGDLADTLVVGVALTIVGYLIQIVIVGSFTALRHTHGTSQEACIVIISAMLFSVQGRVADNALLATSLVLIALSGLALGLALWASGVARAGRYIRLLPFPMVSGFLAGSGMLMITFAMAIVHGEPVSFVEILEGESLTAALKVAIGFAMGAVLVWVGSLRWSEYTLPILIVGSVLAFHVGVSLSPYDVQNLIASDWTLARDAVSVTYQPLSPTLLGQVDWAAVLYASPQLLSLMAVGVLATLIKVSSLEIMMRQRVDENRELRVAGCANLVGGVAAVAPGFHGLSNSTVIFKLRGSAKLSAWVTVGITLALIMLAGDALVQMPRFIFGAILIWLGWGMVYDSLIANLCKLRPYESVITLLIALVVVFFGYLPGLVFGVACGLLMFATEYAQLETVRSFQSAAVLHSNVDRPEQDRRQLTERGEAVRVVRLHSYLFFGSAARSVELITAHLDAADTAVKTLILDMSRVTGVDSTALRAFHRLGLRTESGGIEVWACGASPEVVRAFDKDGDGAIAAFYPTLDLALESAENALLSGADVNASDGALNATVLQGIFDAHGQRVSLAAGEQLMQAGDAPRGLFWLADGVLDATVHTQEGDVRVRRMGAGALIGEVSWYLQQRASATVSAVGAASLLHLSADAVAALQQTHPEVSAQLNAEIARVLAYRLVDNTRQIQQMR